MTSDAGRAEAEAAAAGERLVWWGRPSAGRLAIRAAPAALFGAVFGGFAVHWMWAAAGFALPDASRGGAAWFPLFGLPFLLVGAGLVLSPIFVWATARRTVYGVTDAGVFVLRWGRSRRVERLPLPREGELSRVERADGSGDLDVGRVEMAVRGRSYSRKVTFVGIPDVLRVERLVAEAGRSGRRDAAAFRGPRTPAPAPTAAPRVTPAPGTSLARDGGARVPALVLLAIGIGIGFGLAAGLAGRGWLDLAEARSAVAARAPPASPRQPSAQAPPATPAAPPAPVPAPAGGPDPAASLRQSERECELGRGDGCSRAGFALAYGQHGTPADPVRALPLLERACADGSHPRACAALGDLLSRRGGRERALAILGGCCTWGDGGCCSARRRLEATP